MRNDAWTVDSYWELFVDGTVIESLKGGAQLLLHHPTPQEVVLECDRPWEGNTSGYFSVLQDGKTFRMYYRGSDFDVRRQKATHPEVTCMVESQDGIHWERPNLGLFEFGGSKRNNIVWIGKESHDFAPFVDANPRCDARARYKAIGRSEGGLIAFESPDGVHWRRIQEKPVITEGAFDSLNVAFWDEVLGRYRDYHRGFRDGYRDVMTCESDDFIHWTKPRWLDWGDAPREHLYTNAIRPYFRNPRILLGFPMRFVPDRAKVPEDPYPALCDNVLIVSRDGLRFKRWLEAFQRPGPQRERWVNRNNMPAWGLLVTRSALPGCPDEISFYSVEGYYLPNQIVRVRRFTLRMDGFVSVNAPYSGGEVLTKPLMLQGERLQINYATSAVGSAKVEVTDPRGNPIKGFSADDCVEMYGDEVEADVRWKDADIRSLRGKPVRLRFLLRDADLYAFRCA
ncbi:hypothetical protein HRbin16_02283 [bacterium HR16]|nr:hypothetical protein HRbin16_02283 [bacterium HR16]